MKENLNIKSDEITEILGTPPRWIVRWGITIVFAVIATIFIGSIFFRYPDTVMAPVVITAENPPSVVVARATGKPAAIFVTDGQQVSKGDTLGVIENPANYSHIFQLSRFVTTFSISDILQQINLPGNLVLGDVQSYYNTFSRANNDYQIFSKQRFHHQKIEALQRELGQYEVYSQRLENQRALTLRDIELTQKQFSRDSLLFAGGVIAAIDFEKSQAAMLAKLQALEGAQLSISNTAITMERLKQSIADTRLEYESQQKRLTEDISSNHSQLVTALASWEKNYLLISTSTGKLTFMSIWSDLQEVTTGTPLFAITPESIGEVQARLVIPFAGAGKVKPGQRVNIKLDGYSYMEFGMVEGVIRSISSGYNETGYPALAELPNGSTTSYGIRIQFDRELQGVAEITTEDLSLLQRLFSPLKHLYKSRVE
jgi:multidrug efflux pump subunit AcrA (membrane-fusion protein)